MEKFKSDIESIQNIFGLAKFPIFGTYCSEFNSRKYFVAMAPKWENVRDIQRTYVCLEKKKNKKDLFIIKLENSFKKIDTQIEVNFDHIQSVEIEIKDTDNSIHVEIYVNLTTPPKIFRKKGSDSQHLNFAQKYKSILNSFSFTNDYQFTYEEMNKNGKLRKVTENLKIPHFAINGLNKKLGDKKVKLVSLSKKNNYADYNEDDILFDNNDLDLKAINLNDKVENTGSNFKKMIRVHSYLSHSIEYINFYQLNLVMKLNLVVNSLEELTDFLEKFRLADYVSTTEKGKFLNTNNSLSLNISQVNQSGIKTSHQYIFAKSIFSCDEETKREMDRFIFQKINTFYKNFLNFDHNLQYIILAYICFKRVNIFAFETEYLEELAELDKEDQKRIAEMIESIIKEKMKNSVNALNFKEIMDKVRNAISKINMSTISNLHLNFQSEENNSFSAVSDTMKTRTIEVSPSIVYYKMPMEEKINHILRKYSEYKDHFIKVNFIDEDGSKMYGSSTSTWQLIDFQKNCMLKGILSGSRVFNFLSASNSQMKNASYWFFSLEGTRYCEIDQMISELGDFTHEKNINKNAARRGQCLSTTTFIQMIPPQNLEKIEEIERNGYVFSDGIGKISPDLAEKCSRAFGLKYVYAFQIRIGGIKGVVVVDKVNKKNTILKEDQKKDTIYIRPSMIKFESPDTSLGVIRVSNFSKGYLNRQIIILLSTLGVKNEIFIEMLENDMKKYTDILSGSIYARKRNNYSLDFLNLHLNTQDIEVFDLYYFNTVVKSYMVKGSGSGGETGNSESLHVLNLPFISSLLINSSISRMKYLKSKGKILDPDSTVLIGVIDETDSLEEGEVFIQIAKEASEWREDSREIKGLEVYDKKFIVNQNVIVTKNPCLHPGDIRVLRGVGNNNNYNDSQKIKKLKHCINVVVFSAKGKRPEQNKIGGGDLDGDLYFVSWNEILISSLKSKNVEPLEDSKNSLQVCHDKSLNQSIFMKKDIKLEEIVNAYIDFQKFDTIGIMSNSHSAIADKDVDYQAYNKKCIRLAELFSIAIDAPKHGKFVSLEDLKNEGLSAKEYPDFLENPAFPSYKSPGILGQLYRHVTVDQYIEYFDYNEFHFAIKENYLLDPELISQNCHNYFKTVLQIYLNYLNDIKYLITVNKLSSETELFLFSDIHDEKNNKKIKQNENLFVEFNKLRNLYREMIFRKFNLLAPDEEIKLNFDIASAFYLVTYVNKLSAQKYPFLNQLFLEIESKLNREDCSKISMKDYQMWVKDKKSYTRLIKRKRIFSLPWFIKEIRAELVKVKSKIK